MQEDSQTESEEWEVEGREEWERGEGSGESENSEGLGHLHGEEGDGSSSEGEGEEEVSEREGSCGEGEEEDDVEEQKHTPSAPVGIVDNTITGGPGVREIAENRRETVNSERELLHRRVGHLPLNPHHHPYIVTPTTTPDSAITPTSPSSPSSSGRRQWLLEVTLVLLVATLLLTVCSRLSYDWVARVCDIVSEKPI